MSNTFLEKCINILKREDIKREIKNIITPLLKVILIEIYPYIYISLIVVIISFLLHLGIFCLLLKNTK